MITYGPIDWVLRSNRVVTPDGVRPAAVLVRGEKIAAVVAPDEVPTSIPVEDVGEHFVLPGLVDTHVHINEPGRTEWEGFETATRAAAAGGITTLIDMPLNSSPVTTSVEALRAKRDAARGKLRVDVGFHGGVVPGNTDQIKPLIAAGVCAFKAFLCPSGIDEFPASTADDLRLVMPILAKHGIPLFVHAELMSPLPPGVEEHFGANPRSYPAWQMMRPPEWEAAAIRLMIELCRETGCPVHIVHLSAANACLPLLENAKRKGLPVTIETCPHYLYFASEEIPNGQPLFKCAPPIRERLERARLQDAVANGEIDTIGSDHSPAPLALKGVDGNLSKAWGGISSLQLTLPIVWPILQRVCGWDRIVALLSRCPASLIGLGGRKGAILAGHDADLVVFDPQTTWAVSRDRLHHRHKATPYLGKSVSGVVETTYLRGSKVFDHGEFIDEPSGQLLERAR